MASEPQEPDKLLSQHQSSEKNPSACSDSSLSSCKNDGYQYHKLAPAYEWVSNWTVQMVEKYLHIFYTVEGMGYTGEHVLQQGGIKTELTSYQKEYMHDLQSILTFDGSMYSCKYRGKTEAKPMLQTILKNLAPQNTTHLKDRPIHRYLNNVEGFVEYMVKYVDKVEEETEWFRKVKINEGFYNELVGRFAEMCSLRTKKASATRIPGKGCWHQAAVKVDKMPLCPQLDVMPLSPKVDEMSLSPQLGGLPLSPQQQQNDFDSHRPEKSVWKNLKGIKVISKPDLRFYKGGIGGCECETETAFSVIEVKRDTDTDETCQSAGTKRMKKSLSSESLSEGDSNTSPPIKRRKRQGTSTLADKVKGQHAGELLLDLHSIQRKRFINCSEYYMPGMIVDGTGVSVTMLVISRKHYEKIEKNEPLDEEDRAQIYVSFFYDFLNQKARNELMKVFMILNNIPDIYSGVDNNRTKNS